MRRNITLILGGARSGKSRFAEAHALAIAADRTLQPVYVATSEVRDEEMRERIEHHRQSRDERWQTLEEPLKLSELISAEARPDRILLIDCLTLWLSNQQEQGADMAALTTSLVEALNNASGPVVLVSNEVGLGIVPANELARAFRDVAGRVNQAVARAAIDVFFVASGLTLPLKTNGVPVGPEYS